MRLAVYLMASVLALGLLVSPAAAQQDNQTENQSFSVTGECMVSENQSENFMACNYSLSDDEVDQDNLFEMLRDRIEELFNVTEQGSLSGAQGQ